MSKNEIQIFNNPEFGKFRFIEIDGQVYMVGTEVATALGYTNPRKAVKDHVDKDDVTKRYPISDRLGRTQNVNLINESGFYSLVLASKLPEAKKFKRWVTSEVIPTIRKTGSYSMKPQQIEEHTTIHAQKLTIKADNVTVQNANITLEDDKPKETPPSQKKSAGNKNQLYRSRRRYYMDDLNEIKELLIHYSDYLGATIDKRAGKNMYTCPFCHSGEHGKGSTGAMHIGRGKDGTLLYHCFSCGSGGNIIDMYCQHHGIANTRENFPQIISGINEDLGLFTEDYQEFKKSYKFHSPIENGDLNPSTSVDQKDRTKFYNLALQNQDKAIEYLQSRGIKYARSIAETFQIGYTPAFAYQFEDDKPVATTPAVVIPFDEYSFAWRSTTENIKKKRGQVIPLNLDCLQDSDNKYIFLVEGEFDLFSILDIAESMIECEFSAISVNSAGNLARFIRDYIKDNIQKDVTLIISLDADMNDNPNVKKFVENGLKTAKKCGIPCVLADVDALYLGCKDANEAIQYEREYFKEALLEEVEKAKSLDLDTYMKECEKMNTEIQQDDIIDTDIIDNVTDGDSIGTTTEILQDIITLTKDDFGMDGDEYSPRLLEISEKICDLDSIDDMEKARTSLHAMAKEYKKISSTKELFKKIDKSIKLEKAKQYRTQNNAYPSYLEFDNKGNPLSTISNCYNILSFDEELQGKITYNQFTNQMYFDGEMWQDLHFSKLVRYMEDNYKISKEKPINHAIKLVADENSYHPVKDYLNNLPAWDGKQRVGTMFTDFFGADNNEYTQAVAIVTMCGAVARILKPAVKFDTMTVLIGKQGTGKSTFWNKLGGEWYSDSIDNVKGKEAYESIQNSWIIEFAELSAMGRATVEEVKKFISKCTEKYRKPYATNTETIPRQCIFVGTTNTYEFLKDETGNRRFYPIDVNQECAKLSVFDDLTPEYIAQLWAEALAYYKKHGDNAIYIKNKKILAMADEQQMLHLEKPTMHSDIESYLEMPVPAGWDNCSLEERQNHIKRYNQNPSKVSATIVRKAICIKEILIDLYPETYSPDKEIDTRKSREVAKILVALGWANVGNESKRCGIFGKQRIFTKQN